MYDVCNFRVARARRTRICVGERTKQTSFRRHRRRIHFRAARMKIESPATSFTSSSSRPRDIPRQTLSRQESDFETRPGSRLAAVVVVVVETISKLCYSLTLKTEISVIFYFDAAFRVPFRALIESSVCEHRRCRHHCCHTADVDESVKNAYGARTKQFN